MDVDFEKELGLSSINIIKLLSKSFSNNFRREVNIDNSVIELFFSNTDSLYNQQSVSLSFDESKQVEEIFYIIENMLPQIEKSIIYFLFIQKKNQETTGRILNLSQEMVHYYKKRGLERIKLHYFFRSVNLNDLEVFLEENVTKKQKLAMMEYFKIHDLNRIAVKISKIEKRSNTLTYRTIGERILLGIKTLKEIAGSDKTKDPVLVKKANLYYKIFRILKKYNSLHHTQSKKNVDIELEA